MKSGYRFVAVYNVCLKKPGGDFSATAVMGIENVFVELLKKQWDKHDPSFTWFMEHKYTDQSLSEYGWECFKGNDRSIVLTIQKANELLDPDRQVFF